MTAKKKAAPKKAVKKTAKPKLIDGKYSHKILLRLFPNEGKNLQEIMKDINTEVYSKAVAKAINSYLQMKGKISELEKELSAVRNDRYQYRSALNNFNEALRGLQTIGEDKDEEEEEDNFDDDEEDPDFED